jgi:hypothetical protein
MNFAVGITVLPSSSLKPFPALFITSSTSAWERGESEGEGRKWGRKDEEGEIRKNTREDGGERRWGERREYVR